MHLIVGLGNPGRRYARTRHNAGFFVLDEIARRRGATFATTRHADVARAPGLVLAKPTTFMNVSGLAVQAAMARHAIRPDHVVVVHDDLDLPLGRVRVKRGGSAAGQRGVQDIIDRVGDDFVRVRVGIGRPPAGWPSERWVLSPFDDGERETLERVLTAAADAVDVLLERGLEAAMNVTNGLDLAAPAEQPTEVPTEVPTEASGRGTPGPDAPRGRAPAPDATARPEAPAPDATARPEAPAPETPASEGRTPEAPAPEALEPEALEPEPLAPEALTPDDERDATAADPSQRR
jgi:peptidyl-tRNA hydrolase, PTH1 family